MSVDPQKTAFEQRLLKVVGELFFQHGYKRVTMDDICRELGISKKTLYQHVSSKDALVEMFVEHTLGGIAKEIEALIIESEDLPSLTAQLFPLLGSRLQVISRPMIVDLQRHWPHLWERINARRLQVLGRLAERLEKGQDKGVLRPSVHPRLLVRILQVIFVEVMTPKTFIELEVTPQEAMQTVLTVLLQGALNDGEPENEQRAFVRKFGRQ